MDNQLEQIIEASIRLENNVARIYSIFFAAFEQHAGFWWKLHLEERNHAAIIRTVRDYFKPVGVFPDNLLPDNLQQIEDCNARIQELIKQYKKQPPDEAKAFNLALQLEQTACETHYQDFINRDDKLSNLFRRLNRDDIDHANRIMAYMKQHNIAIQETNLLGDS